MKNGLFWDSDREFKLKRDDGGEGALWKNEIPDKDVCVKPPLAACPAVSQELCSPGMGCQPLERPGIAWMWHSCPFTHPKTAAVLPWVFPCPELRVAPGCSGPGVFVSGSSLLCCRAGIRGFLHLEALLVPPVLFYLLWCSLHHANPSLLSTIQTQPLYEHSPSMLIST